jgi:hypothetical protein
VIAQELIAEAQSAGLELSLDRGGIHWRCAGDPPADLLGRIKALRDDVMALLEQSAVPVPDSSPAEEDAINEAIEERAAIREFDGGETRETAEREARSAMRVYRYRVTDKPGTWLTMIAPGCDLEDAARDLRGRFGERLLEVVEHVWRSRR